MIFVYAQFVPVRDAQSQWTPVFPPILIVAISLLVGIWASRRGHLLLATILSLVSAALAAIMAFIVAFAVGWISSESTSSVATSQTWVNVISALAVACFLLCVLTFITCVVALLSRPSPEPG